MVDATVNAPGRRFHSPVDMSRQAPFVDAATSMDPTNRPNTFLSYYTWGAALGLALDLAIRTEFDRTLDDYMRALWTRHGRFQQDFAPARPYTLEDLETTLGEVASPAFAEEWFARFVHGRDVPDFRALLATAGFALRPARPGSVWIGEEAIAVRGGRALVVVPVTAGSPLQQAGIAVGDIVVSIADRPLVDDAALEAALNGRSPGETAPVTFVSRGDTLTAELTFTENPRVEVRTGEEAGTTVTQAAQTAREAWLRSRAADGR
jgi:predicted metalloprotease with PDZ domain